MRALKYLIVIPALVLMVASCGPHRQHGWHHGDQYHGGGGMMGHGCSQESCMYRSRCFSNGAVSSNDGVCQSCNGGRWVEAHGCRDDGAHHCCAGMKCDGKKCPKGGPCCQHGGKPMPCQQHDRKS